MAHCLNVCYIHFLFAVSTLYGKNAGRIRVPTAGASCLLHVRGSPHTSCRQETSQRLQEIIYHQSLPRLW